MADAQQLPLSGDTTQKFTPLKVTATTNAGAQTIHTASATAGVVDSVWLDLINTSPNLVRVNILKGGTTEPDNLIPVDVPPAGTDASGRRRVMDGIPICGGASIKIYAATPNVINFDGWVNRMPGAQ